jgi:DNA polymerase IV (DinB-like DNA polymerase)
MPSSRLPGVSDEGTAAVVCHVDVDCFYAACERLREPALRGEPVVVGMGYEPGDSGGAVATASYEAREHGVESAQPIPTALERLPRKVDAARDPDLCVEEAGFYRPVDMSYYESVAAEIRELLGDCGDVVREVSIDEAYLDVSDRVSWEGTPGDYARQLKGQIADAVGVTASVGIAPTMSAAKVASDHDKPDGLVVVEPGEVCSFFAPLPVDTVHGVGPVTARELREMGIETAGELAEADPARIEAAFGDRGLAVRRYARGEDDRGVEPRGDPKSLSRESAIEPTEDHTRKREVVRSLAGAVADRAARKGALYQTVGIKVVTPPFDVRTRAETLPGPVEDRELVAEIALDLLGEFADAEVRKLGVRVSKLSFTESEQPPLDSWGDTHADRPGDDGEQGARQRSLEEF